MGLSPWVLYLLLHLSLCTRAIVLPLAEDPNVPDRAIAPRPETTSAALDEEQDILLRRGKVEKEKECEKKYRVCAAKAQDLAAEWQNLQDMLIFWEGRLIVYNSTRSQMKYCGRLEDERLYYESHPYRRRDDPTRNFTYVSTRSIKSTTSTNSTSPNSSPMPNFVDCFNSSVPVNSTLAKSCKPQYSSSKTRFCDYNDWCDEGAHYREMKIGMEQTRLTHLKMLISTAALDAAACAAFDPTPDTKKAKRNLDSPSTGQQHIENMVDLTMDTAVTDNTELKKLVRRSHDGKDYAVSVALAKEECEHVKQNMESISRSSSDWLHRVNQDLTMWDLSDMNKTAHKPPVALPAKSPAPHATTAANNQRSSKRESNEAAKEDCGDKCQKEIGDRDKIAYDKCKKRVQTLRTEISSNWNNINQVIARLGYEFGAPQLPVMKRDLTDLDLAAELPGQNPESEELPLHQHKERAYMNEFEQDRANFERSNGAFWMNEYKDAFFQYHETTNLLIQGTWNMAKKVKEHIHRGMAAEASSSKALHASPTQATATEATQTVTYTVTQTVRPATPVYAVGKTTTTESTSAASEVEA